MMTTPMELGFDPMLAMRSWVAVAVLLLAGCGDSEAGSGTASVHVGRGSVACQDWQDAVCDLAAERCGLIARAQCDAQYQGVECRSDEQASECSNQLNEATCTGSPPGCDVPDIADPAPAISKCETILEAVCDREAMCGSTRSRVECVAAVKLTLGFDCSGALAVSRGYETCIETIEAAQCTLAVPLDACMGVIFVGAPGT